MFPFDPLENIRKPKVKTCKYGNKWENAIDNDIIDATVCGNNYPMMRFQVHMVSIP